MLRHSLILKIYAYAVVAFSALAVVIYFAFDTMMRNQEVSIFQERVSPQVTFLADEVAEAGPGTPAGKARLVELQRGMSVQLWYYPWSDSTHIPAKLRREAQDMETGASTSPYGQFYWVRVDQAGKAIGALRVRFRPPFRSNRQQQSRRFYYWPLLVIGMLALVLIPPLIYWVIHPLRRLEGLVLRLADGDLKTPVRLDRQDELGRLAAAFDSMRLQVRRMLHEKEHLLTDVSHELRGPLTRMALAQDLLEDDLGNNPYIARLRKELGNLDTLTGELLSLSRNRHGVPLTVSAVDLSAVAGELVAERDLLAGQTGITLKAALAPAQTEGDAALLLRACGNLIDNALKYTPSGGTVLVESRLVNDRVIFSVTDTGIGITAEALPHVFEPFYRPDAARSRETGGSGLGLAIVKAIIDRHRGDVTLASTDGQGTTATISLPALIG
ncbi:MAG: HAMP domain-containing histidine kinase [Candidatus Sericytochromatia bacterium]|nr:HAMP domain-containing histidine kinase [Candidatus Sericytochromatia bacterium]